MKMNRNRWCGRTRENSFRKPSMKTSVLCGLLMILVLALMASGQGPVSSESIYGVVVETVQEMNRLLDVAIEVAMLGIGNRFPDEQLASARVLVNLLEGPNSPLFDPSVGSSTVIGSGLLPLWEEYFSLVYAIDNDAGRDALASFLPLPTLMSIGDAMVFGMGDFLMLASRAVQRVAGIQGDTEDARAARSDAFRSAYAHLVVVRGSVGDPHLVNGFRVIAELLPPLVVWISPGESIQEAIDRLPKGGVIHLAPGVYEEILTIDKSVTLVGSGQGATILQGVSWRISVLVAAEVPIDVAILDLTLSGGQGGFLIAGAAQVALDSVEFLSVGAGVHVGETASVVATACRFEGCPAAVSLSNTSHGELRNGCRIEDTPEGSLWTVIVNNSSSLVVSDCTIENNATNGIFLQGDVSLHITDSVIQNNDGYGIGFCHPFPGLQMEEERDEPYDGTVTGGGNIIPGADEENPNLRGAFCPDSLDFLTEPLPED